MIDVTFSLVQHVWMYDWTKECWVCMLCGLTRASRAQAAAGCARKPGYKALMSADKPAPGSPSAPIDAKGNDPFDPADPGNKGGTHNTETLGEKVGDFFHPHHKHGAESDVPNTQPPERPGFVAETGPIPTNIPPKVTPQSQTARFSYDTDPANESHLKSSGNELAEEQV
jgi:hypothetical protein